MNEEGTVRSRGSELPEKYSAVRAALQAMLDACDYVDGKPHPNDRICDVASPEVLAMARKALAR